MKRVSRRGDRPRVSCIITTFNYADFVAQAVDSALAQTYGEDALEVIVVDGASTDDTPSVVEPYRDRITYIREPSNEGVVSSANRGLDAASGNLIAFLNADDVWYPTTAERLSERLAARPEIGLVYGDMEMIDAVGTTLHPSYYERFGIQPQSGRLLGRLLRGNFIASGCFMFRAELLSACHPIPDWVPWEDWYIVLRLAAVARFEYLPLPVLRYRFHGANQVLMAEGERLLGTWRKELPFRRRLLTEVSPRAISAADLIDAVATFDAMARRLGEAAPDRLAAVLPTGDADRAEASAAADAASRSEDDRDDEAALFHWARAFAHAPGDREPRRRLARLATRLLDEEAGAAEERRTALGALALPGPAWSAHTRQEEPLDTALRTLRELTARVPTIAPEPAPRPRALTAMLERVSAVDPGERTAAVTRLRKLGPWEQGPFPVATGLEFGQTATRSWRHEALLAKLPDDLAGRRVLDVPSNAGYVAFALSLRGPEGVIACEPGPAHHQALALERLYSSGVDFRPLGWADLHPPELGRFELIHADGLLDGDFRPFPALERVRELLADDGRLYLGFTRLAAAERSVYVRLVAGGRDGNLNGLPGGMALRWMVEAAGLSLLREIGVRSSDLDGIPVECGYLELALSSSRAERIAFRGAPTRR